jgi:hypothetical protein
MAAKIDQLQNIMAATRLGDLKGAMSDKDIVFLKNIAGALKRSQSEEQFIKELDRVGAAMQRGLQGLAKKTGLPLVSAELSETAATPRPAPSDDVDSKWGLKKPGGV